MKSFQPRCTEALYSSLPGRYCGISPGWIVLVCASLGFLGFFEANSGRIEILGGSGGVPRVIASALALNTVVCGVLFELGHLLRHL